MKTLLHVHTGMLRTVFFQCDSSSRVELHVLIRTFRHMLFSLLLCDSGHVSRHNEVFVAGVVLDAAAREVADGLRMAEAVSVLLPRGRRQVRRVNHQRQLHLHERIPRLHWTTRHHSTHWQVHACVCFVLNSRWLNVNAPLHLYSRWFMRCICGRVVECRTCGHEVAGSCLTRGYCVPTQTLRAILPEWVNEYLYCTVVFKDF